ncbi:MAG TPA: cobalt-precorrin-5B (C(1))-methyltransferase CbiD [Candidatus Brocadiales bacterium]|nr:cobalt-precorrin-5B (C(1))-methyltransferase CbiD [Candidatus Brocadiales bacterium]
MSNLRYGYTTGSCAAGATLAATQGLLTGTIPDRVELLTPSGVSLSLEILEKSLARDSASCAVRKDAGSDPDVTHGCLVFARIAPHYPPCHSDPERREGEESPQPSKEKILIDGGEGVGRVTKPGLRVPPGQAAINPVPRDMIHSAATPLLKKWRGLKVTISVPGGEELAKKTFNPRLGILGGISIIGTTGIVRPMSQEALKDSITACLDVARALGHETTVLVPGNLGERACRRNFKLPQEQVVEMGNFLGFTLVEAAKRGFRRIILAGHPGKLAKLLRGDLDTHSLKSAPAMDIINKILKEEGLEEEALRTLDNSLTVEGILQELKSRGKLELMDCVADRIESEAETLLQRKTEMGVILFDMELGIAGLSKGAKKWQEGLGTR